MNIEEAKKLIDKQSIGKGGVGDIPVVKTNIVKVLLDQIEPDQPKPVVPHFVAKWYKENKDNFEEEICYQIWLIRESGAETDFEYWLIGTENPIQTLINMHQFGYTVKKEKLYTVEIPNPNIIGNEHTVLMKNGFGQIVMLRVCGDDWRTDKGYQITESEIRKDFDWAWQFRKDVENE
ncbi:DUF1642 domain-containing protein [Streptococcus agalactiae]|uniref:DUF1642 domain-containing protein n=1 Tax=Streptococcus agalactiae TaxID=1311 RepID=UPI003626C386